VLARILLVAAGGALGSVLRYLASLGFAAANLARWPFATWTVNVLGSFALGLVMTALPHPSVLRLALTTGVLGGFTTYSAFNLETVDLLRQDGPSIGLGYVVATVVGGLLAGFLGIALGERLHPG
jgi:CrcB protein